MKRELLETFDYLLLTASSAEGAGKVQLNHARKEYMITFNGLKQLEMKHDKKTRVYYNQLEEVLQQAIEYSNQQ